MAKDVGIKSFSQWIAWTLSAIDKVKPDGTPAELVLLTLMHASGALEREIHTIKIGARKFDNEAISNLAAMFEGLAGTDAQNLSGNQQYVCYAYFSGDETKAGARFILRVNGHLVNRPGDLSTEAATPEGRLQQRMRHDETYSQMLVTTLANTINQLSAVSKLQHDQLYQVSTERNELFGKVYEMLLEQAKSNREHELKVLAYERSTKIMTSIAKVAPALMNTISGREIVPQSTVDTTIVEMLAESLEEKDLPMLQPLLSKVPPEMLGVIFARLESIMKKKTADDDRVTSAIDNMDHESLARAELGRNGHGE